MTQRPRVPRIQHDGQGFFPLCRGQRRVGCSKRHSYWTKFNDSSLDVGVIGRAKLAALWASKRLPASESSFRDSRRGSPLDRHSVTFHPASSCSAVVNNPSGVIADSVPPSQGFTRAGNEALFSMKRARSARLIQRELLGQAIHRDGEPPMKMQKMSWIKPLDRPWRFIEKSFFDN